MSEPPWSAEVTLQVPFHDVDMMGVVWHGHYARYFEMARSALLRGFDYDYRQMKASGYAWPVIDLRVRYAQPLTFEQRVVVRARLTEYEYRLKIDYDIRDEATGESLTRGHTIQVALDMSAGEMCLASPPVLLEKLGVAPP
jgi:acyl-CoA thioester hydrolase